MEEPEIPTVTDPDPQPKKPKENLTLEIILVVLICIPARVIVVLLFLPQRNKHTKDFCVHPSAHRPKYLDDSAYFDDLDLL